MIIVAIKFFDAHRPAISDQMTVRKAGMLFSHISSPGPGFTQTLAFWFTMMDSEYDKEKLRILKSSQRCLQATLQL